MRIQDQDDTKRWNHRSHNTVYGTVIDQEDMITRFEASTRKIEHAELNSLEKVLKKVRNLILDISRLETSRQHVEILRKKTLKMARCRLKVLSKMTLRIKDQKILKKIGSEIINKKALDTPITAAQIPLVHTQERSTPRFSSFPCFSQQQEVNEKIRVAEVPCMLRHGSRDVTWAEIRDNKHNLNIRK